MIVVDTNVICYLLMPGERTAAAERLYRADPEWIAPRLWLDELLNVLATSERQAFLDVSGCSPTRSPYAIRSISRRLKRRMASIAPSVSRCPASAPSSVARSACIDSGFPCPRRTCSHEAGSAMTTSARCGPAEKIRRRVSSAPGSRCRDSH